MAKRRKASKVQKKKGATRGKPRKPSKAARGKATVAKAKAKRTPVKKPARKVKQPVAPVVETATVEVIERPVAVTEIVETEVREVRPGPDEPEAC